jgi:hypothetical protein
MAKSMVVGTLAMMLAAPSVHAGVRFGVFVGTPRRPRPVRLVRPVVAHVPAYRVVVGPRVAVHPGFGRLAVEVEPHRARIYIDGRYEGRGDATETLRGGLHAVKVVLPDGRKIKRTVRVKPGRLTTIHLDLT